MTLTLEDWKNLAITQEYLAELKRRIEEQKELLAGSAGVNSAVDSYRSGVIAAYKDAVDFSFEGETT